MKQQSIGLAPRWDATRVLSRLGIEHPIIQGALGGVATQRLTATVSNFGGLGSFGAHGLDPSQIKDVIAEIRSLTSRPFAINLWISMDDEGARTSDSEAFARSLVPLPETFESRAENSRLTGRMSRESLKTMFGGAGCKGASVQLYLWNSSEAYPGHRRAQGIATIGTATTRDQAIGLEQAGIDVIAASGSEAGGHRGSLLRPKSTLTGHSRLYLKSRMRYRCRSSPQAASLMPAESPPHLPWGQRACRSEWYSWQAKKPVRVRSIAKNSQRRSSRTGLTKGFMGRLARGSAISC